jgi:hypothetical protein
MRNGPSFHTIPFAKTRCAILRYVTDVGACPSYSI